ncbi:MAG: DsrE family protein [Alphaproteobacteria bacterium]|nr:DsrE family protein [Alphaproteobacteria bacterium]
MTLSRRNAMVAAVTAGFASAMAPITARAATKQPLFINLSSDDPHRITMALNFGGNQMNRGHALTIFMNDKAVLAASKANTADFLGQQQTMGVLLDSGATILVCPTCMNHFGVADADLVDRLKVGSPNLTGEALFKENTQTLTW